MLFSVPLTAIGREIVAFVLFVLLLLFVLPRSRDEDDEGEGETNSTFDDDEFVTFFSFATVLDLFVNGEGEGEFVTFFSLATVLVLFVSVMFVALDFAPLIHSGEGEGEGEGEINSVLDVEEFVKLFAAVLELV